jgi:hypothetical protein
MAVLDDDTRVTIRTASAGPGRGRHDCHRDRRLTRRPGPGHPLLSSARPRTCRSPGPPPSWPRDGRVQAAPVPRPLRHRVIPAGQTHARIPLWVRRSHRRDRRELPPDARPRLHGPPVLDHRPGHARRQRRVPMAACPGTTIATRVTVASGCSGVVIAVRPSAARDLDSSRLNSQVASRIRRRRVATSGSPPLRCGDPRSPRRSADVRSGELRARAAHPVARARPIGRDALCGLRKGHRWCHVACGVVLDCAFRSGSASR